MSGINKNPILSICIPTWNRSKILDISLKNFLDQIKDVNLPELELYVSDNCSEDETEQVVKKYISQGLPITYNRNESNIGAAGNFVKCMQWASGKYILLLGDDDVLKQGALKYILDMLRGKDYGLLHLNQCVKNDGEPIVYNFKLLVKHQNVKDENVPYVGSRKGFKIAGAKEILDQYYGQYFYFKMSWTKYVKMCVRNEIKKVIKFFK